MSWWPSGRPGGVSWFIPSASPSTSTTGASRTTTATNRSTPRSRPTAPPAYFSSLPVKAMVTAMRRAGVPAAVSNTAGTYVCNHIMYQVLYMIDHEFPGKRGGFVHVPYSPQQVVDKPGQPCLGIDDMTTRSRRRPRRDRRVHGQGRRAHRGRGAPLALRTRTSRPSRRPPRRHRIKSPQGGTWRHTAPRCPDPAPTSASSGRTPFTVSLHAFERLLLLEVEDGSQAGPVHVAAQVLDTGGRGLAIVTLLCHDWGVGARPAGKSVWAEFEMR